MDHTDHLALLRPGIPAPGGVWAELGAGAGAFTLALAELLGPGAVIHAVDRDAAALRQLAAALRPRRPGIELHLHNADFTRALDLPVLDGLLLANSLHFVARKEPLLAALAEMLRPGGVLLLVEYNVDRGNPWVPYPLSFASWQQLAQRSGFRDTRLLGSRPSRFLQEIYSAASRKGSHDHL